MGRGKVELKRIENKLKRQVSFAKRRNGLLKKAYELSLLCDAQVALIIFSSRGKLYEFSTASSSMTDTLERYQRCTYGCFDGSQAADQNENSYHEYLRLKARAEILQRYHRNLLGDDLVNLSTKELQHFEHQLDTSLKHVRSTKTHFMLDQLADIQLKGQKLAEDNHFLKRKLEESRGGNYVNDVRLSTREAERADIEEPIINHPYKYNINHLINPTQTLTHQDPARFFFQPLGLNHPTLLQIGYINPAGSSDVHNGGYVNGFAPGPGGGGFML